MSGPTCNTFFNQSNNWLNAVTTARVPMYWQLLIPAGTTSSVSIAPDAGDIWNYQIFASNGQLPQPNNADISNCYASGCTGVLSINFTNVNPTQDQTWYISVIPSFSNVTYAIWFGALCAPGCTNNGVCTYSGPNIGQCNCSSSYLGAACQYSNTLSAQYIVLIIIACLLFTSTIVGFVAQAYLKRKGYQNI